MPERRPKTKFRRAPAAGPADVVRLPSLPNSAAPSGVRQAASWAGLAVAVGALPCAATHPTSPLLWLGAAGGLAAGPAARRLAHACGVPREAQLDAVASTLVGTTLLGVVCGSHAVADMQRFGPGLRTTLVALGAMNLLAFSVNNLQALRMAVPGFGAHVGLGWFTRAWTAALNGGLQSLTAIAAYHAVQAESTGDTLRMGCATLAAAGISAVTYAATRGADAPEALAPFAHPQVWGPILGAANAFGLVLAVGTDAWRLGASVLSVWTAA